MEENIIIFIDETCLVCNRFTQWIIQADKSGKFKFSSIQRMDYQEIVKKYPFLKDIDSIVVLKNKEVFYYFKAIKIIGEELNLSLKILFSLLNLLPNKLLDYFYKKFASNRYLFGNLKDCSILNHENLKSRIIQ